MRVLVLSPGTAQQQLERMPAIAACANELGASIQVACSPGYRSLWTLLPSVEKIIPFDFSANLTMADWANLLPFQLVGAITEAHLPAAAVRGPRSSALRAS